MAPKIPTPKAMPAKKPAPAPRGIVAKMFAGKGISNGVKPGKAKGC